MKYRLTTHIFQKLKYVVFENFDVDGEECTFSEFSQLLKDGGGRKIIMLLTTPNLCNRNLPIVEVSAKTQGYARNRILTMRENQWQVTLTNPEQRPQFHISIKTTIPILGTSRKIRQQHYEGNMKLFNPKRSLKQHHPQIIHISQIKKKFRPQTLKQRKTSPIHQKEVK